MSQQPDQSLQESESKLGDATDKITVLRRLLNFFYLPDDAAITCPRDLVNVIYPRVSLAHEVARVESSSSWDYCKVTAIDWLNKTPRWIPIHETAYWYQIECVPPHFQSYNLTMVGEAYTGPWHLTLMARSDDTYWCCLLKQAMVITPQIISAMPFADIPMLGLPEEEES